MNGNYGNGAASPKKRRNRTSKMLVKMPEFASFALYGPDTTKTRGVAGIRGGKYKVGDAVHLTTDDHLVPVVTKAPGKGGGMMRLLATVRAFSGFDRQAVEKTLEHKGLHLLNVSEVGPQVPASRGGRALSLRPLVVGGVVLPRRDAISELEALVEEDQGAERAYASQQALLSFGHWVRATRVEKNMTQGQLAEKAGTTTAQISNIEAGLSPRGPTLDLVARIASSLGFQVNFEKLTK